MTRTQAPHRQTGFSLLELMLTITVLGILVALAVPSFSYLAASTKMKGAATDLHLALLKARSEAVKRNSPVTITPASSTDWGRGWTMAAGAQTLAVQDALQGVTITPIPSPLATLVFQSNGRLTVGINPPSFNLAPFARNANEQVSVEMRRCISIQANGSPYVQEAACP